MTNLYAPIIHKLRDSHCAQVRQQQVKMTFCYAYDVAHVLLLTIHYTLVNPFIFRYCGEKRIAAFHIVYMH